MQVTEKVLNSCQNKDSWILPLPPQNIGYKNLHSKLEEILNFININKYINT